MPFRWLPLTKLTPGSVGLLGTALSSGCGARTGLEMDRQGEAQDAPAVTSVLGVAQVLDGVRWYSGERFTCKEAANPPSSCEKDEDCCTHRCVSAGNIFHPDEKACYPYGPPNMPCSPGDVWNCAGGCSPCDAPGSPGFERASYDCRGVCMPSSPGRPCRWDADCLIPPCLPPPPMTLYGGFCFVCTQDSDCPGSTCQRPGGYCMDKKHLLEDYF
jgi:hypothetical protein